MKENILITGGLGFVGHHLTLRLLKDMPGCSITIVDNCSGSRHCADMIPVQPNIKVHYADFLDFESSEQFTQIYHLASPVGSLGILNREKGVAREILELAGKVAHIAARSHAKLMYISSSEIYGGANGSDEDNPIVIKKNYGLRTEYALGKLAGEIFLKNESLRSGIVYNVCRPFNLIGERQSEELGFVVPIFFNHALANKPLPVYGDGQQVRSFCYIGDFVEGLIKFQHSDLREALLNLGNEGNKISIVELARKIIAVTGSSSQIEYVDPEQKYGKLYVEGGEKIANTFNARKLLNWKPRTNLDEALKRIYTSDYHKEACQA